MAVSHWMIQGKGGVGKSVCSSLLAQYLKETEGAEHVQCFDTDPINATFAAYKELSVTLVDIMDGNNVDPRKFDALIEYMFALPSGVQAVVDNGASSFIQMCSYLKTMDAFAMLREAGHQVVLHTVVTGGQATADTLNGFASLAGSFSGNPIVVWRNRYFGPVQACGVELEDMAVWKEHRADVYALVDIPHRDPGTFGVDLRTLFSQHRTFAEAEQDASLPIMQRQRLKMFWRTMRDNLERSGVACF